MFVLFRLLPFRAGTLSLMSCSCSLILSDDSSRVWCFGFLFALAKKDISDSLNEENCKRPAYILK